MFKGLGGKLLELLQDSVITQSLLVILVFTPIAWCVFTGNPIPDSLDKYGFAIIGFFFGSKASLQLMKGASKK